MPALSANLYARWRAQILAHPALHEAGEDSPPERLLQEVWYHQRLRRDQLRTLDGRGLRVLHPGFWNREAGPDFQGAVLQWDNGQVHIGDIEVDLHFSGWRTHGHHENPAFSKVLLHVVWDDGVSLPCSMPVLALKEFLDSPWTELSSSLAPLATALPEALLGQCAAPLEQLEPAVVCEILRQAALVRLRGKGIQLQARARLVGWEQSLWEGLFRGLGYKQNLWPMQCLAECIPQILAGVGFDSAHALMLVQARLLGCSGLLPQELTWSDQSTDFYLRRLWDHWWRDRDLVRSRILPRSLWRLHGVRPVNHPQRRIALAAHWLADKDFIPRLEHWFTSLSSEAHCLEALAEILNPEGDDYWFTHWAFRSASLAKPQPLLGAARLTDLVVNIILPWFWVRAATGNRPELRQKAETCYFDWPCGQDNAVLRLARQRLLNGKKLSLFETAAAQQGLLQIVYDFCNYSNAICAGCRFPDLVRNLVAADDITT